MTGKDRIEPTAPNLRPAPQRIDVGAPPGRRWFPTHRGVVRWARDVGVPEVAPWSAAFTIRHRVRSQKIADDGGEGVNLDGWRDPRVLPAWGEPAETPDGWELPYAVRLEGMAENAIEFALVDGVSWSDPPFGPPPLRRRHLRPQHIEADFETPDTSGVALQVIELIWHRRI